MTQAIGMSCLSTAFLAPSTCLNSYLVVWVCFLVTESHHVTKAGLELAMFKLSIKLKLTSSSVSSCLRLPSGHERALQICRHHNITALDQCLKKKNLPGPRNTRLENAVMRHHSTHVQATRCLSKRGCHSKTSAAPTLGSQSCFW